MNALNKWRDLTTKSTRWVDEKNSQCIKCSRFSGQFWMLEEYARFLSLISSVIFINEDELLYIVSSSILTLGRWQGRLNLAVIPLLPLLINAPLILSRVDFVLSLKSNSDNSALPKSTLTLHCCTFWHSDCYRKRFHIRKQHHSVLHLNVSLAILTHSHMQWEFILSKEALLLPEAIPHPEVLLLDLSYDLELYSLTLGAA